MRGHLSKCEAGKPALWPSMRHLPDPEARKDAHSYTGGLHRRNPAAGSIGTSHGPFLPARRNPRAAAAGATWRAIRVGPAPHHPEKACEWSASRGVIRISRGPHFGLALPLRIWGDAAPGYGGWVRRM